MLRPLPVRLVSSVALAMCVVSCDDSPTSPLPLTELNIVCVRETDAHQCRAVAMLPDGSQSDVTRDSRWSSSNTNVATVNATGLVTHIRTGSTDIRATYADFSATLTLTIVVSGEPSSGAGVVINEFASRILAGEACGEFVEIRNDGTANVDISGWQVLAWNLTTNTTVYAIVTSGTVLRPGCHYLIATPVAALSRDSEPLSCGLSDNGGLALANPSGAVVDQVGMNALSPYREGQPLPDFPASSTPSSYARVGNDRDNNFTDFVFGIATPQNLSSSCSLR
jgi:hypothetical protein